MQVVGHPADQRAWIGWRILRELFLRELGADESINALVRMLRGERLKRPPGFVATLGFDRRTVARIGRAQLHPRHQISDHGVGQLRFLRRHFQILDLVPHGLDQQTFLRLAGDDGGFSGIAALLPAGFRIEVKVALELLRLRAVALVAMLDEHRSNFLFEEGDAGRLGGRKRSQRREQQRSDERERGFHGDVFRFELLWKGDSSATSISAPACSPR